VVTDHEPINKSQKSPDSRSAMIVPQQAAESFPVFNLPGYGSDFRPRIDQPVFQTLMVSLPVIMRDILVERSAEASFTEENHSAQSFGFQASHKSFEVRIQIRTSRGEQDRFHTGAVGQILPHRLKLGVPVHQQMRRVPQKTFVSSSQVTADLSNPFSIRIGRHSGDLDSTLTSSTLEKNES